MREEPQAHEGVLIVSRERRKMLADKLFDGVVTQERSEQDRHGGQV